MLEEKLNKCIFAERNVIHYQNSKMDCIDCRGYLIECVNYFPFKKYRKGDYLKVNENIQR
jgi:hypothetical protein